MQFINSNIRINIRRMDDAIETIMCEKEFSEKYYGIEYLQTCYTHDDMDLLKVILRQSELGKAVMNVMKNKDMRYSINRIEWASIVDKNSLIDALKEEFIGE